MHDDRRVQRYGRGPRAATLEVAHDWPNSPFRVPVEGLAVDPKGIVSLVTEIDFGDVPVGTKSARAAYR